MEEERKQLRYLLKHLPVKTEANDYKQFTEKCGADLSKALFTCVNSAVGSTDFWQTGQVLSMTLIRARSPQEVERQITAKTTTSTYLFNNPDQQFEMISRAVWSCDKDGFRTVLCAQK